jgi:hypothetical protein
MKGRQDPLALKGSHSVQWLDYSELNGIGPARRFRGHPYRLAMKSDQYRGVEWFPSGATTTLQATREAPNIRKTAKLMKQKSYGNEATSSREG